MKNTKWLAEILDAFNANNGSASLQEIYDYIHKNFISEYKDEHIWDAQIRRVIYQYSSDCDIFNGKDDLFMPENNKGDGQWMLRRRREINDIDSLMNLQLGSLIGANEISQISKHNQVKGIHPLENDAVAVLCTLNGASYRNEWIEKPELLKYYLEGRTNSDGRKIYNINITTNQAIINATNDTPVLVFIRNKKGDLFSYYGKYLCKEVASEADDAKYFILQKIGAIIDLSKIITSEDIEDFPEGREKERLHKYKERNKRLIDQAKKSFKERHGRLFCEVCDFDFVEKYGQDLGTDFIEAHHTIPVSNLKENSTTNINDLIMVCANCHRMLHRKRPWLEVKDLKKIITY